MKTQTFTLTTRIKAATIVFVAIAVVSIAMLAHVAAGQSVSFSTATAATVPTGLVLGGIFAMGVKQAPFRTQLAWWIVASAAAAIVFSAAAYFLFY